MKHFIVFLLIFIISCGKQNNKSNKIDSTARLLNDSAVSLANNIPLSLDQPNKFKNENLLKAILLLDQATEIDSNYLIAYSNKLSYQCELGQYERAVETAKHIIKIRPHFADIYGTIGMLYYKMNDSISSNKYFSNALIQYDYFLDTMNINNINYFTLRMNKAVTLKFLGQNALGNNMLDELNNKQTDSTFKQLIASLKGKSKDELINYFEQK